MYNQKQKSNVHLRKKHKTADRKGGGSTLTVSLTVKYPLFFFDNFPNQLTTTCATLMCNEGKDIFLWKM